MVRCKICGREMLKADGCRVTKLYIDGKQFDRIHFGKETRFWPPEEGERCHDCNVAVGQYHHYGCDVEECPLCDGQLIGCDCEDVVFGE